MSKVFKSRRSLVAGLTIVLTATIAAPVDHIAAGEVAAPDRACSDRTASDLDQLFQGQVGRVVGADYVRSFVLPNGNTLLLMQDVFLASPRTTRTITSLGKAAFVHNAGVLIDAHGCVVRTLTGPRSYIGNSKTRTLSRWFWAMGGGMGADGNLHLTVAEMRNPNRTGAALGALPVATWHATIDPESLVVTSFAPAADASAALYGWAVASDSHYSYLYSHCYRQFIPGEPFGHDLSCTSTVNVARVPLGRFDSPPEYWSGNDWTTDPVAATPLAFGGHRTVNPVSIQNFDGTFVSVSKEGDWWGTTIFVDTAPTAVGPWTTVATIAAAAKCEACNTYFASLMPWRQADGSLVVALSNNAWDMRRVAYPNPWIYRPSFIEVVLPTVATSSAINTTYSADHDSRINETEPYARQQSTAGIEHGPRP